MSTDRPQPSDRELWRSLATDHLAPEKVSDLDLAGWLDGRLPAAEAQRVEAAIAAAPELRRAALDLSEILGKPLPLPPARLSVRAKALVGFEVEGGSARAGLFGWLFAPDRRFAIQRAAILGAAVVVATAGFQMGGGLGRSFVQERQAGTVYASNAAQGWSSVFELTELPTSEGI